MNNDADFGWHYPPGCAGPPEDGRWDEFEESVMSGNYDDEVKYYFDSNNATDKKRENWLATSNAESEYICFMDDLI